jgi:hypothetical protein
LSRSPKISSRVWYRYMLDAIRFYSLIARLSI